MPRDAVKTYGRSKAGQQQQRDDLFDAVLAGAAPSAATAAPAKPKQLDYDPYVFDSDDDETEAPPPVWSPAWKSQVLQSIKSVAPASAVARSPKSPGLARPKKPGSGKSGVSPGSGTPGGRPRGRPPKHATDDKSPAVVGRPAKVNGPSPSPRGRGRPPVLQGASAASPGRPRGRPPKVGTGESPRPRGRPPKQQAAGGEASLGSPVTGSPAPSASPRGRPPKHVGVPSPRGRPPKLANGASPSSSPLTSAVETQWRLSLGSSPSPRRGRGRPPGIGSSSPRGRGRPPGSSGQSPRGRGRPPLNSRPATGRGRPSSSSPLPKRGRGRPPLTWLSPSARGRSPWSSGLSPRGRGRPSLGAASPRGRGRPPLAGAIGRGVTSPGRGGSHAVATSRGGGVGSLSPRGRPSKSPTLVSSASPAKRQRLETQSPGGSARPRGRPPKQQQQQTGIASPSPKRGRPPKLQIGGSQSPKTAWSPKLQITATGSPKRGRPPKLLQGGASSPRGRPPKQPASEPKPPPAAAAASGSVLELSELEQPQVADAAGSPAGPQPPLKRHSPGSSAPRGRPPKQPRVEASSPLPSPSPGVPSPSPGVSSPAKRRGRPPKHRGEAVPERESSAAAELSEAGAASLSTAAAEPQPAAEPDGTGQAAVASPRRRGRPPKQRQQQAVAATGGGGAAASAEEAAAGLAVDNGGPACDDAAAEGRPKEGVTDSPRPSAALSAAAGLTAASLLAGGQKRGRGRPPRSASTAAAFAEPPATNSTIAATTGSALVEVAGAAAGADQLVSQSPEDTVGSDHDRVAIAAAAAKPPGAREADGSVTSEPTVAAPPAKEQVAADAAVVVGTGGSDEPRVSVAAPRPAHDAPASSCTAEADGVAVGSDRQQLRAGEAPTSAAAATAQQATAVGAAAAAAAAAVNVAPADGLAAAAATGAAEKGCATSTAASGDDKDAADASDDECDDDEAAEPTGAVSTATLRANDSTCPPPPRSKRFVRTPRTKAQGKYTYNPRPWCEGEEDRQEKPKQQQPQREEAANEGDEDDDDVRVASIGEVPSVTAGSEPSSSQSSSQQHRVRRSPEPGEPPRIRKAVTWPTKIGDSAVTSLKLYTVVHNVKHASECQESGESQQFDDDLEYLLDGMKDSESFSTRCLSALSLAAKCASPAFRMHLKAEGTVIHIFQLLQDACSDKSLALCTACVMYMLSRDRLNMDLDKRCLALMVQLLSESPPPGATDKEYEKVKDKVVTLCCSPESSGSQDPSPSADADNLLCSADISAAHLAMESLLSLTSRRAGDWFKEELRLLGGLDHIVDAVSDCEGSLSASNSGRLAPTSSDRLQKICRCLRVLENVTFLNTENQEYLMSYEDGVIISSLCKLLMLCEATVCTPAPIDSEEGDDAKFNGTVLQTLLSTLRLLLNLTHDSVSASKSADGDGRLIECCVRCILRCPQHLPSEQRFDVFVLGLGLLINLMEHSSKNRSFLGSLRLPPSAAGNGEQPDARSTGAIAAICEMFLQRMRAADKLEKEAASDSSSGPSGAPDVAATMADDPAGAAALDSSSSTAAGASPHDDTLTEILHKAGKHMEDSIVAAYAALVLGCLVLGRGGDGSSCSGDAASTAEERSTDAGGEAGSSSSGGGVEAVRASLPDGNLRPLVDVLQKFLGFIKLTDATASSGSRSIADVIQALERAC